MEYEVILEQGFRVMLAGLKRMLREKLGSAHPLRQCFDVIGRDVRLEVASALDLFARAGDWQTRHYANLVGSLELWELLPEHEAALRLRYPSSTVRIGDSYARLRSAPSRKFDIIFSDNSASRHGVANEHFEHFDIFPYVLDWLEPKGGFLVLNVILNTDAQFRAQFPAFSERDASERARFYGVEDASTLSIVSAVSAYSNHCVAAGRSVAWHWYKPNGLIGYLVLKIEGVGGGG